MDTNRYVDFAKGDPNVLNIVKRANEVWLPLVVIAELRAGFLCGNQSAENEKNLLRFLNSPRVGVLNPDDSTTHIYARLFSQLKQQGTPIPTNDIWIAALALQHDAILCSRDQHFKHVAQVPII